MQNEYEVLMKKETWVLVEPIVGTKAINYKWVYKNKYMYYGSLDKFMARVVEEIYAHKEGIVRVSLDSE